MTVTWEILSNVRVALNNNGEFVKAKGNLVFREGSTREFLSINVRNDGVPELNETFYIRLINVTGEHCQRQFFQYFEIFCILQQ